MNFLNLVAYKAWTYTSKGLLGGPVSEWNGNIASKQAIYSYANQNTRALIKIQKTS